MSAEVIVFIVFAVAALAGGGTMVLARNPIHSALGLLLAMFSMAVFFVMNDAHFVAAVHVLIYAGAVMTLFLFVIMLIGVDKTEDTSESLPFQRRLIAGLAGLIILLGGALAIGGDFKWTPGAPANTPIPNGTVEAVAGPMFTDWLLHFEATALLLTIAAAGAIALAYFKRDKGDIEEAAE